MKIDYTDVIYVKVNLPYDFVLFLTARCYTSACYANIVHLLEIVFKTLLLLKNLSIYPSLFASHEVLNIRANRVEPR